MDANGDTLRGQLLIASPGLLDPNFARTVVLVVEHNDEGAMGIVLNRPSEAPVAEAVPPLEELVAGDEPVYVGVAGQTASYVDLEHSLGAHLPAVLAVVVAATLIVLFLMTGSVVLPVKAV